MPLRRQTHDESFRAYVHIGNPKCASTSLQSLLSRERDISYLGKNKKARAPEDVTRDDNTGVAYFVDDAIGWSIRREIPAVSDISYDADMVRAALGGAVDAARRAGLASVHLSDEVLSGIGLSLYRMHREPVGTIARRLVDALGVPVTFLLIPRSQPEFLWSYYRQLLTTGYPLSFRGFVADQCVLPGGDSPRRTAAANGIMGHLEYDRVVRAVRDHGDLVVVPFEELVAGQAGVDRVLAALGLRTGRELPRRNVGVEEPEVLLARNVEKLRGIATRTPAGLLRADTKRRRLAEKGESTASSWRDEITSDMAAVFAESNARLGDLIGVDLAALGWAVESSGQR